MAKAHLAELYFESRSPEQLRDCPIRQEKNKAFRPEANLILSHADLACRSLMFVLLSMPLVMARDLGHIQGAFNRLVLSSNLRQPIFVER